MRSGRRAKNMCLIYNAWDFWILNLFDFWSFVKNADLGTGNSEGIKAWMSITDDDIYRAPIWRKRKLDRSVMATWIKPRSTFDGKWRFLTIQQLENFVEIFPKGTMCPLEGIKKMETIELRFWILRKAFSVWDHISAGSGRFSPGLNFWWISIKQWHVEFQW